MLSSKHEQHLHTLPDSEAGELQQLQLVSTSTMYRRLLIKEVVIREDSRCLAIHVITELKWMLCIIVGWRLNNDAKADI
jgi:hypothetical protein